MSAEKVLQDLKDELGHITLVADWADRKLKSLSECCAGLAPAAAAVQAPEAVTEADVADLNAAKEGQDAVPSEGDALPGG